MMHAIPHAVFLHVEADTHDASVMSEALKRVTGNVRVRRVSAAETALDLVSGGGEGGPPFDCVISSLCLPGLDGAGLARRLRQRFDVATLPVFGLTRDAPASTPDCDWFDAVFQKASDARGLLPVAAAIVDLWFSQARRFHC
ncbi:response regulator [Stappia sp. ES.058]|uniref:response regulator n=1 Tax=Stappia sp. ES.058 TaxID=1881061 RepID=UPI00087A345C|nr:response regulator [Stappia sp. ES.058]SDT89038.1 Response regulator receiver domain-containing protein [Stappia sp. ES.058]